MGCRELIEIFCNYNPHPAHTPKNKLLAHPVKKKKQKIRLITMLELTQTELRQLTNLQDYAPAGSISLFFCDQINHQILKLIIFAPEMSKSECLLERSTRREGQINLIVLIYHFLT